MTLEHESPNVITKAYFVELVNAGYRAEIICQSDAYSKASVWCGEWVIRVVSPDGTFEKFLASTGHQDVEQEEIEFRVFKRANGVMSFMHAAGFTYTTIPFKEGGRSSHTIP